MRRIIDYINNLICWFNRNRSIKTSGECIKLNIGSGLSVASGWINIDASLNAFFSKWPPFFLKIIYRISGAKQFYSQDEYCSILTNHFFIHHNAIYGIPFPCKSIDYLYSSHFLEHLSKENAQNFLREARRVLKKDGVLRINIPDLEYAISLYQKGEKENALNFFFAAESSYLSRHQYMYDFEMLKQLLKKAGFVNIERYSYRQGKVPDVEVLDNRPEESLYVEANRLE